MADVPATQGDDAGLVVDDVGRGLGWPLFLEDGVTGVEQRSFSLPTGTVTFLMSDVEGSTPLWEDAPEAMTVAIPRHYELMDEAIISAGGVRPVEQGEGDSVVGAFSRASDALAAAVAAQRAFVAEPWPAGADLAVRMAVHTGEAQLSDETYYLGQALNRCARIRATGHGGQILVSAPTAALVTDRLPASSTLEDLGLHRLKDLGRPEHVFQLVHPELPSAFPPLRSLDAYRHNLPTQLTPLVGRTGEIADVAGLVGDDRLVTLTGSAGVGKTRLALAVAADCVDRFAGGVWWVELAPLADPSGVGRAVLAAVGAREGPGLPIVSQLAAALGDEPSLLVLDNCEHLVGSCAELVATLLVANRAVTVLATSREPLGVPGEITWRVPSLRCPDPDQRLITPALSQYDAVALFIERAQRARPSFVVTDANAPAIAQICHRLDGIPLAIELGAARCRQMPAERIATELEDRFRLLTGGARTVMARQQTLAASIDWSHDRLDESEQVAFRRLGVFAGPFPLEAAEAVVASTGDIESVAVFDLISRLVDKSLVVADENASSELRYRLLETLRIYALERARATNELAALRDAHAGWWADWIEPRGAMPTDHSLKDIADCHANLASALAWGVNHPPLGLRLLRGVARAWTETGRAGDAIDAADRLLTDEIAHPYGSEWLAAANDAAALYWSARGPSAHIEVLERIEGIAAAFDDEYQLARARFYQSPESRALVRDMARACGDRYVEAEATIYLAYGRAEDQPAEATDLLVEAGSLAVSCQNEYLRSEALMAQAQAAASQGDLARSIELAVAVAKAGSRATWHDAVRLLSEAALLGRDDDLGRFSLDVGEQLVHSSPGEAYSLDDARHRMRLLAGDQPTARRPDELDTDLDICPTTLWLECR
jgi:predicted ATPase/class 3 adenylate cyclase